MLAQWQLFYFYIYVLFCNKGHFKNVISINEIYQLI